MLLVPRYWPPVRRSSQRLRERSGLISAFSLHLVKTGRVPVELGKALNKAEDLRLVADYKGDPIENEDAGWAVQQAEVFVHAMQSTFIPQATEDGHGSTAKPF